jgi:hypothetical protein
MTTAAAAPGVHQALWISVSVTPDLGPDALLIDKRIIRRNPAIVMKTKDFSEMIIEQLGIFLGTSLSRRKEYKSIFIKGYA